MSQIKIHQIYYKNEQKKNLEASFHPYYNDSNVGKKWFEYGVFKKEFEKRSIPLNGFIGYMSWKFYTKTDVHGKKFIEFIEKNPGFDVYFINPFLMESLMFQSQWENGEFHHRGITEITNNVFKSIGYDSHILEKPQKSDIQLYSNYWVGNESFWLKYMSYTLPVYRYVENLTDTELLKLILTNADKKIQATYIPFIMERLFTLLLMSDSSIRYMPYRYSNSELKKKYKVFFPFISILESIKEEEISTGLKKEDFRFREKFRKIYDELSLILFEMKMVLKKGRIIRFLKLLFLYNKEVSGLVDLYKEASTLGYSDGINYGGFRGTKLYWMMNLFCLRFYY